MPNLRGKTWTTTTPANVEDAQYWEDHLISDTAALKAASSVQSVNSITPDAQGNVDVVALPAGGTAGQVLTKQSSTTGDADWEDPASSGHTIEDEDGNIMPYQETLQFENAEVTNDSVNNKTIVDCKGSKGDAATIAVGTVTTLPAGADATVTNSGTSSDAVFDFGIPKGADGEGAVDSVNGYTGVVVLNASDVGALPDSTTIPTKTSELDNDSGFVTSSAIPTSLSELSDDTTHRLVTDAEKTAWDAKVSESLLEDTVGWVGKNELQIPSSVVSSGIYTVNRNNDGEVASIVANGTPSTQANLLLSSSITLDKPMILNGCPVGGGDDNYFIYIKNSSAVYLKDYGSGVYLDAGTYTELTIVTRANIVMPNIPFKPMLRDASITDSTFEPYHESVSEWGYTREEANVLGAKNLLRIPSSVVSDTKNNVVYTVTRNSGGQVIEIDANGLSNADGAFLLIDRQAALDVGRYRLSGCAVSNDYLIYVNAMNGSTFVKQIANTGTGLNEFDVDYVGYSSLSIGIYVVNGKNLSHVKFYPMITLATDTDTTFQPYAMTNRELTDELTTKEGSITTNFTFGNVHTVRKYGKVVELNLQLTGIENVTAYSTAIAQISAGFRPNADIQPVSFLKVGSEKVVRGYIKRTTGEMQLQENVASGANAEYRVFATWITP